MKNLGGEVIGKRGMIMDQMGNKIANRRKELGMTQVSLADVLAVTRQTVSRWEAGVSHS